MVVAVYSDSVILCTHYIMLNLSNDVLDLVRVRVFVAVCCAGDGLPPLVLISA